MGDAAAEDRCAQWTRLEGAPRRGTACRYPPGPGASEAPQGDSLGEIGDRDGPEESGR